MEQPETALGVPATEAAPKKRQRRAANVAPDTQAPELLDNTEVTSAFGFVRMRAEVLNPVLEEVGLERTIDPASGRGGWSAIAVSMLTADPPAPLRRLGAEGDAERELRCTFNTARTLGIWTRQVRDVMVGAGAEDGQNGYWLRRDVERLVAEPTELLVEVRLRGRAGRASADGTGASGLPVRPAILRGSEIDPLEVAIAHLGPTNSGKTYEALQALVSRAKDSPRGVCVYAAPLRMMAQEAYADLAERLGPEMVGLLTGEEKVNVEAPVICATTELAPLRGDLLCLDEVQWCADPMRGPAWTQRMLNGEYREMRLIGALDIGPIVTREVPFDAAAEALLEPHTKLIMVPDEAGAAPRRSGDDARDD